MLANRIFRLLRNIREGTWVSSLSAFWFAVARLGAPEWDQSISNIPPGHSPIDLQRAACDKTLQVLCKDSKCFSKDTELKGN